MSTPETKAATPMIEMEGVSVGSLQDPEATVLEEVNWAVAKDDYWVVAGMHGSGKTDLITTTAGLMPPRTGVYRFCGKEMPMFEEDQVSQRLRLGTVFSSGQLFHRLTVAENISLPLRYHHNTGPEETEEKLKAVLELTELMDFAERAPGQIAVNWQKRAALARALILNPEMLVLDNPLGGMDFRHANWWLSFLGKLSAGHEFFGGRKLTLVLTADDLRPWRSRATHFALLQARSLTVLGQRKVLTNNAEPLVREMLAEEQLDG